MVWDDLWWRPDPGLLFLHLVGKPCFIDGQMQSSISWLHMGNPAKWGHQFNRRLQIASSAQLIAKTPWLPDGYSRFACRRLDYGSAPLRSKIGSLPFPGLRLPPALHPGAIRGIEGIKVCHLATLRRPRTSVEQQRRPTSWLSPGFLSINWLNAVTLWFDNSKLITVLKSFIIRLLVRSIF